MAAAPPPRRVRSAARRKRCDQRHALTVLAASSGSSSSDRSAGASTAASTAAALAGLRFTSPDGRWVVRPLVKSDPAEVRRVVALQTEAFHSAPQLAALEGLSRRFFEPEVLSGEGLRGGGEMLVAGPPANSSQPICESAPWNNADQCTNAHPTTTI